MQGKYIDFGIEPEHVSVKIGENQCNVTQLGSSVLLCRPQKPEELSKDEPLWEVVVSDLSILYSLKYTPKRSYVLHNVECSGRKCILKCMNKVCTKYCNNYLQVDMILILYSTQIHNCALSLLQ